MSFTKTLNALLSPLSSSIIMSILVYIFIYYDFMGSLLNDEFTEIVILVFISIVTYTVCILILSKGKIISNFKSFYRAKLITKNIEHL